MMDLVHFKNGNISQKINSQLMFDLDYKMSPNSSLFSQPISYLERNQIDNIDYLKLSNNLFDGQTLAALGNFSTVLDNSDLGKIYLLWCVKCPKATEQKKLFYVGKTHQTI